jgi:hypothetical protein
LKSNQLMLVIICMHVFSMLPIGQAFDQTVQMTIQASDALVLPINQKVPILFTNNKLSRGVVGVKSCQNPKSDDGLAPAL